ERSRLGGLAGFVLVVAQVLHFGLEDLHRLSKASGQLRQFGRAEDDHDDEDHDRDLHETWSHGEFVALLMLRKSLRVAAVPFIHIRTRYVSQPSLRRAAATASVSSISVITSA